MYKSWRVERRCGQNLVKYHKFNLKNDSFIFNFFWQGNNGIKEVERGKGNLILGLSIPKVTTLAIRPRFHRLINLMSHFYHR